MSPACRGGIYRISRQFFQFKSASEVIVLSLSVAVVIMAETLLAENNFAQKNGYRIDDNTELLAFSIGNMAAALRAAVR